MYGWTGKILKIDLNSRSTSIENPDKTVYEKYIGGKGLAGYFLKPFVTRAWTDSAMPLLFFTGPLNNTYKPVNCSSNSVEGFANKPVFINCSFFLL